MLTWEEGLTLHHAWTPVLYSRGVESLHYDIYKKPENNKYQLEIIDGDMVLECLFHTDIEKIKHYCELFAAEHDIHEKTIALHREVVFGDDEVYRVG